MNTYNGSCHCGKIKFSVVTNIQKVVSCNCSICAKKGVLHHRVEPEQFNLISGKEHLTLYQFETKKAKHYFCRQCGIHSFSNPRAAPDKYTINVRCLNDLDLNAESYELVNFDGQNWEKKASALNVELDTNMKNQSDA